MKTLLPLYVHPVDDPAAWDLIAHSSHDTTVIVNVHNGPGAALEPPYAAATGQLARAGVPMVGYVDLGYGRRPLPEVMADLAAWRRYPITGVFFDQSPTAAADVTTVAVAVRTARRSGYSTVILNPGTVPAAVYRDLDAQVCSFEGGWDAYLRWDGDGACIGDGHLVYGVHVDRCAEAERLAARRGAGFGLVSDVCWPRPYERLPTSYASAAGSYRRAASSYAAAAGSVGTRTTTGS